MKKEQFIIKLRIKLYNLPKKDLEERLTFYSEMIDDRIESGLSEEEAIAEVGSADEVAKEIIGELTEENSYHETNKKKRLSALQIVLLTLGSPLWLALLISAFAVIISVYAVIWSITVALWAIELPFFIFYYISVGLMAAFKWITKASARITYGVFSLIGKFFKGGSV